jgi:hypothetical protein
MPAALGAARLISLLVLQLQLQLVVVALASAAAAAATTAAVNTDANPGRPPLATASPAARCLRASSGPAFVEGESLQGFSYVGASVQMPLVGSLTEKNATANVAATLAAMRAWVQHAAQLAPAPAQVIVFPETVRAMTRARIALVRVCMLWIGLARRDATYLPSLHTPPLVSFLSCWPILSPPSHLPLHSVPALLLCSCSIGKAPRRAATRSAPMPCAGCPP